MGAFQRLNGKKGLIAIVLMIATIMTIPFSGAYYTWTVNYDIRPLTIPVTFTIPMTSGATTAAYRLCT